MCPERPEGRNCKQMIKNRPPVHRQAIQTGKCKKASQSLRPQAQRKSDHFLRRHVRRRKYRSARKRAHWAPLVSNACAAASCIFFKREPSAAVSFESACALSAGGCRQDRGQIRAGSRAPAHGGAPPPPPSARGGGDGARPRSACGGAPATERSRPVPARSPAE